MSHDISPEKLAAIERVDRERRMYCQMLLEKWKKEAEERKALKLKKRK